MLKLLSLLPRLALWAALLLMLTPAEAQQKGKASYYSRRANGARTSSGVRLNNDSLVCAHRTHPFGTLLKVRNPANGKEVIVKVIDRGPHTRGRVIDLSYEAARRLDILTTGVALVEVSVYDELKIPFKLPIRHFLELDLELPIEDEDDVMTPAWQRKSPEQMSEADKKKTVSTHDNGKIDSLGVKGEKGGKKPGGLKKEHKEEKTAKNTHKTLTTKKK